MNAMTFLVSTLFDLYLMVVILRIWLQLARADFYNPFSQFVVKATHPILAPMRRVIPSVSRLDTASLVLALLVASLKFVVLGLISGSQMNALGIGISAVVTLIHETFNLMFWVIIIRAILSWFSQGYNPIELVLHQLTEPLLAPIRKVIPPMGGLDLSVLFVLLGLKFFEMLIMDILKGLIL